MLPQSWHLCWQNIRCSLQKFVSQKNIWHLRPSWFIGTDGVALSPSWLSRLSARLWIERFRVRPLQGLSRYFSKRCELRLFNAVVAYNILVSPSGFGKVAKAWCHSRPSDGDVKWRSREQDLGFSVVSVLRISVVFLWDESWWINSRMGSCLPRNIWPLHRKEQGVSPVAIHDHHGGQGCLWAVW